MILLARSAFRIPHSNATAESMISETFKGGRKALKITLCPAPADGKRHPIVLLAHGNFGLGPPYGDQIRGFGKSLAELG